MSTAATNAAVTQGTLRTPDGRVLPLARTDVRARISGPIARVEVRQRFTNPTDQAIEAVYVFPLPGEASVHHMAFRIADRVVQAVIKEKEEARRTYERARREGRAATLLEQDRPSVFTLSVANVPPNATIDVELGYDEVLAYDDGEWRFVFPMVAPERYHEHPAQDAARRPPRLPSGERAGDVDIEVEVRAPEAIDSLVCPTHLVDINPVDETCRRVRLTPAAAIANRDFVLAFRAGGAGVRPIVRFERAAGQAGTFLVMITPPADVPPAQRLGSGQMRALTCGNCGGAVTDINAIKEIAGLGPVVPCTFCGALLAPSADGPITRASRPRDVLVLVDRSASMRGSLAQARKAVRALLESLPAGDAVQVLAFDHERVALDSAGTSYLAVAPSVIDRVDTFLAELSPRGGTELEAALERAAKLRERPDRTTVVVLVSDLSVGNEGRLLRRAPELLGTGRRLFVLGVGPALDRSLATRLARACGGAADSLAPGEDVDATVARFARRMRAGGPVLTGLSLSWADARPADVYPAPIPDLFGGQPVKLLGRFDGAGPSRLVLTGATVEGQAFRQEIDVELPAADDRTPGLERLWARHRIDAAQERLEREPGQASAVRAEVLALALRHSLMSPYTALVAEDSEVVSKGEPRRVDVAAPQPADFDDEEAEASEGMAMPGMAPMGAPPGGAPMPATAASMLAMAAPIARSAAAPAPSAFAAPGAAFAPPPAPEPELAARARSSAPAPAKLERAGGLLGAVGGLVRRVLGSDDSDVTEVLSEEVVPPPVEGRAAPTTKPKARRDLRETVLSRPRPRQIAIEPPGSDPYDADELRWLGSRASGELDLVFLVDETGSMGPYIEQVKEHLLALVAALRGSPLCKSLRLGLVTYRDHPPQDNTYASRAVALTEDIGAIRSAVEGMQASGGGDGPESVTDGLFDIVRLDWRPRAARAVVWFGDAPPHGVEPHGDGFPQGCPCGNHWYAQAESCREMGIGVYAVGCLPGLAHYAGAVDVFRTVAQTTGGAYLPLTQADRLVPLIAGAAATELDKQRIDEHLADVVAAHAEELRRTDEAERIRWLTETLRAKGVRPRSMDYRDEDAAPAPLRFRTIEPDDVAGALDRLRLGGRAQV